MARLIVKLGGKYLEWSTVTDAPRTYGMTLAELREHIRFERGEDGLAALPERLARVEATGTSSQDVVTVDELIECNRAGPNERELTKTELIAKYCAGPVLP